MQAARPIIGITGNYGTKGCELAQGYYESVLQAGGIPLVLPPYTDAEALCQTLDRVDGILLSGGGDINPLLLGEEPIPGLHGICPQRDEMELQLVREAYNHQIPMLGICRGIQTLVAALGGTIYQDLNTQYSEAPLVKHDQDLDRAYASHTVKVEAGSTLASLFPEAVEKGLPVNSFHHQAVHTPGPLLRVSAKATDGVIEAVESNEFKSIIGVQWHPECFITRGERYMMPLFNWLITEASSFAEAKRIHSRIITLDSHCDTPMFFSEGFTADMFAKRTDKVLVDLPKMREGFLDASIMVAYLKQGERDAESLLAATAKADRILTQIEEMVAANCTAVDIAYTPADIAHLKRAGKKAIMLGIENGYAIGKDISQLEHFAKRGIVYMTLCHNGDNDICDSARGNAEHGGLSQFGEKVVQEMNRLGIMVDMSHAAESSFYDALEVSQKPIACSHSSARALCNHPRNLTDEQMKALAQKGGVAQVTMYNGFLRTDGQATILDAVEHLNHMVNIMGIEHVGIGTDFDGDGGVPGMANASEIINFTRRLLRERYSEEQIQMIWGGNFLRVMEQNKNN
ncbi:MAG: gamma-glutamyl-gamma-aminobutyrate hydrolase family protein [Bacteroidaceae bacterium]|nr:gamma-glutamyl-gamma-aminobutyrate hydrolase family protein [Bacteroidaceae bacterium]